MTRSPRSGAVARGRDSRPATLPAPPADVAGVLAGYPANIRARLMEVRRLIFETAAATDGVGPLTETLKWGEPAYLTEATRSGSTVRMAWKAADPDRFRLLFNCNTTLVDTFRSLFADELTFEGGRAIVFDVAERVPARPAAACIAMALTYHRDKR